MKTFVLFALFAVYANAQVLLQGSPLLSGIAYDINEHPDLASDYINSSSDLNRDGIPDNQQAAAPMVAAPIATRVMTTTIGSPLTYSLGTRALPLPLLGRKRRQAPEDYMYASTDMNQDGIPDIQQAVPAVLPAAPLAWNGVRTVAQIPYGVLEHPNLPSDYLSASTDLNRDGMPDVLQGMPAPVLLGRKKRQILTSLPADYAYASTDVNRDGIPDIQQALPAVLPAAPLVLNGVRTVASLPYGVLEHPNLASDFLSASSDLNRDGIPDVRQTPLLGAAVLPAGPAVLPAGATTIRLI